jgi:molybdopterin-guanine dinucleotide biosynthesis protein A
MMAMHGELTWPPETAKEQIALWEQREQRYKLRKVAPSREELRVIALVRRHDICYLPLEEREVATQFLATAVDAEALRGDRPRHRRV